MYNAGAISFNKFKSMITPDLAEQWGANAREIQATKFLQDDREALQFLNEFTQPQRVLWLYECKVAWEPGWRGRVSEREWSVGRR